MHVKSLPLLFCLLSACASQRASTAKVEPSGEIANRRTEDPGGDRDGDREGPLFPVPKHGMSIRVDENHRVSLDRLVEEFARSTGQGVMISESARELLQHTWHASATDVEVAPGEVYEFVEAILDHHGFVLIEAKHDEPRLLGLYAPKRASLLSDAVPVSVNSMRECAHHPALLVQTVVDVSPMDSNMVSEQMRRLADDHQVELIQPLGNDGQVVVIGRGKEVAEWVTLMRQSADVARAAGSRGSSAPRAKPEQVQLAQEVQ